MPKTKRGAMVASIMMLVAIISSACERSFSQQPSVTNTPINPNSLFATPISGATQMTDVERFATETQLAATTGTPATTTPTGIGITPQSSATSTSTPLVSTAPTFTPTATLAISGPSATSGAAATPVPVGTRPASYVLQRGEFPFCIARRFDVDPEELLAINGLSSGDDIFYSGFTLKIPQTGNRFPPPRALNPHTAGQIHTVTVNEETVHAVACYYGDIDPDAIAKANGISVTATLTAGQQLKIP